MIGSCPDVAHCRPKRMASAHNRLPDGCRLPPFVPRAMVAPVKPALRLIAVFVLFGWLLVIGHLAVVHGAGAYSSVDHELFSHEDDHHDDDPDHHHHVITVLPPGSLSKGALHKALVPVWMPYFDALAERLALPPRDPVVQRAVIPPLTEPPDVRNSGWLLVCRTARPVRGPSLAV